MSAGRIAIRVLFTVTLAVCAAVSAMFVVTRQNVLLPSPEQGIGITFSPQHARWYGLDPQQVFLAALDDLGVRHIRFATYWSSVEASDDVFDYSDIDWYLDEAASRGARVTLAVGMKTPRWPECHIPSWVSDERRGEELLEYLEQVVLRYKDHSALSRWQIENEAHFPFGKCPTPDLAMFRREVELVKSLDGDTPVQLTVSGEQEPWAATADLADVLGVSLYRFAWNPHVGLVVFPHPPEYYALQAATIRSDVETMVISELQAEPWFEGPVPEDVQEKYALFTEERLNDHVAFARGTGFSEVYLWGVEWWYALYNEGETRLWDAARAAVQSK